jgi:hypothetical protein
MTAKTGVRMATNRPISEASVGADDGTAEGGELFMMLLNRRRRSRSKRALWDARLLTEPAGGAVVTNDGAAWTVSDTAQLVR